MGLSISPQDIQVRWPELIRAVRSRDLQLQALLRAGEPVAVDDDTILIRFKHEYHAQRTSERQNLQLLEEVLGQLVGQPVSVRCLSPGESPPERVPVPQVADSGPPVDQAMLELFRSEVIQLRDEQKRLEADVARLRTIVTQAKAALETIVRNIEAGRQEIARLDGRHSELVGQNRQLELALQTLRQESQSLNLDVAGLREQKESMAREVESRRQESQSLSLDVAGLREQKESLVREVESLQQAVSDLTASRDGLEAEIARQKKKRARSEERTRSSVDLPPIKGLDNIIGRR